MVLDIVGLLFPEYLTCRGGFSTVMVSVCRGPGDVSGHERLENSICESHSVSQPVHPRNWSRALLESMLTNILCVVMRAYGLGTNEVAVQHRKVSLLPV